MSDTGLDLEREAHFRPKTLSPWLAALTIIAIGAASGAEGFRAALRWVEGGAVPSASLLFGLGLGVLLVAFGLLMLVGRIRGWPRLALRAEGLELETVFGTSWANWDSLGDFAIQTIYSGPLRRRMNVASAAITGSSVSAKLRRKAKLSIPDAFTTPLAGIVTTINARRARALGLAPAPAAAVPQRTEPPRQFGAAGANIPWLSFLILAVLVVVFVAEQLFAIGPGGPLLGPNLATLQALGGVDRSLVFTDGEWYRLFTAPLLHGDVIHILFNGIALVMAGFLLERLVGRTWFLGFFLIGALGGSLMSIALNPAGLLSIGASGAIMGLLAAAYISSFRLPAGSKARWWTQLGAARLLIPALLPLATSHAATRIDYGAHLGGALAGATAAFLLLRAWPDTARLPLFRGLAAGIGVAGVVGIVAGTAATAETYPHYRLLSGLIPQNELPKTRDEGQRRSTDLVARFPDDPRSHYYRALALESGRDHGGAERELRIALAEAEERAFFLGPTLPWTMRAILAAVLFEDGRTEDAKAVAAPLCLAPDDRSPPEQLRHVLTERRLCG